MNDSLICIFTKRLRAEQAGSTSKMLVIALLKKTHGQHGHCCSGVFLQGECCKLEMFQNRTSSHGVHLALELVFCLILHFFLFVSTNSQANFFLYLKYGSSQILVSPKISAVVQNCVQKQIDHLITFLYKFIYNVYIYICVYVSSQW